MNFGMSFGLILHITIALGVLILAAAVTLVFLLVKDMHKDNYKKLNDFANSLDNFINKENKNVR